MPSTNSLHALRTRRSTSTARPTLVASIVALTVAIAAPIVGCRRDPTPTSTSPVPAKLDRSASATSASVSASTAASKPVPAGWVRVEHVELRFGVYFLRTSKADVQAILRSVPEARDFVVVNTVPATRPDAATIVVLSPKIDDVPPPSVESLKYRSRGLDDDQKKALAKSDQCAGLAFYVSGDRLDALSAQARRIVGEVAKRTGGIAWDAAPRQALSETEWKARADAFENGIPIVKKHIAIDMYRDGELLRLVTLGMENLGLPDIVVNNVSGSDAESMGSLISTLGQALVEQGSIAKEGEFDLSIDALKTTAAYSDLSFRSGAKKRVHLHLAIGVPQEGDADNRLIEIVFPGPARSLQERQGATLHEFFGADDSIVHVKHDEKIVAASAAARAKFMTFKPVWSKGVPQLQRMMVKAPFTTTSGGTEWMWVELTRWEGTTIHGILQNDPFEVPKLHAGAHVSVEEGSIFDYILRHADGTQEGNETAKFLE